SGIAFAECLVSFVDEDITAPQGLQQAENFLEIALRAAHPFIAKVFEFQNGDTSLTGETLDQVSLSRADWTAEQVPFGQRRDVVCIPELDILPQPGLYLVESADVVEGAL